MTELSDSDLLRLWESMRLQSMPRRAAALLAVATPGLSLDRITALTPGECERRLLMLRAECFGPHLACVADCAHCGEAFEFELDARHLAAGLPALAEPPAPRVVELGEYRVAFRLPNVGDGIAIGEAAEGAEVAGTADAGQAYRRLLQRCLHGATREGVEIAADALPSAVLEEVSARMAAEDPAAELLLSLACPACGQPSTAPLDMAAFCWAEIEARAPRLLADVHLLASRYGWHEADILAMSPVRRERYLELVLS